MQPDRIVIGAFAARATATPSSALHAGIDAPIVRMRRRLGRDDQARRERALMTRISFINEIANVCEATGADVVQVAEGVGLDHRIGPQLPARRDRLRRLLLPEGLARAEAAGGELGLPLPAPERRDRGERAAEAPGDRQARSGTSGSLRGKTVALLGLAFKPNTDDMREAPSLVLAGRLRRRGRGGARAGTRSSTGRELPRGRDRRRRRSRRCDGADAAVIVTEWPQLARGRLGRGGRGAMRGRC